MMSDLDSPRRFFRDQIKISEREDARYNYKIGNILAAVSGREPKRHELHWKEKNQRAKDINRR